MAKEEKKEKKAEKKAEKKEKKSEDEDEDEDGGHLMLIFIIVFVVIILLIVIYFVVAYFLGWPPFSVGRSDGNSSSTPCSDNQLLSVDDAYKKYLDGGIVDNPLSLSSQASNTTHTLKLRKLANSSSNCFAEGTITVPFPKYCSAFLNYLQENEYEMEPNQTSTTSRTYVDAEGNVITFRQNCVPVTTDEYFYSPTTKW